MSKRAVTNEQQERMLNVLLEAVTNPDNGLLPEDLPHYRLVNGFYKDPGELLDRLLFGYEKWPQMQREILLSTIVVALDRLLA